MLVNSEHSLADGSDYSAVRFAILVMMLIANITESNFACMSPLGFMFLLAAIGQGRPVWEQSVSPATDVISDLTGTEVQPELQVKEVPDR